MPDYVKMPAGEMYQALGCDARKWADAFSQIATMANPLGKALRSFPDSDAQEELHSIMISWFANAMMAQADFQDERQPILCGDHAQWLIDQPA